MSAIGIMRGADWSGQVTWADEGGAVDLTGYNLSASLLAPPETIQAATSVVEAAQGKWAVSLPASQTARLSMSSPNWLTLEAVAPSGEVTRFPPVVILADRPPGEFVVTPLQGGEAVQAPGHRIEIATRGAPGPKGDEGAGRDGESAYEVALRNGFAGTEAEWLESLVGPEGPVGGSSGGAGQDGADGQDGASAYEVAVANGFAGTQAQWLDSLRGVDGRDGVDGRNGVDGQPGAKGADGADGPEGPRGPTGQDGAPGADGADGAPGADGADGADLLVAQPGQGQQVSSANPGRIVYELPS